MLPKKVSLVPISPVINFLKLWLGKYKKKPKLPLKNEYEDNAALENELNHNEDHLKNRPDDHLPMKNRSDDHLQLKNGSDDPLPLENGYDNDLPLTNDSDHTLSKKNGSGGHLPLKNEPDDHMPPKNGCHDHLQLKNGSDNYLPLKNGSDDHLSLKNGSDDHLPRQNGSDDHLPLKNELDILLPLKNDSDIQLPQKNESMLPLKILAPMKKKNNKLLLEFMKTELDDFILACNKRESTVPIHILQELPVDKQLDHPTKMLPSLMMKKKRRLDLQFLKTELDDFTLACNKFSLEKGKLFI